MPVLEWIGRDAVVGYHRRVPFHLMTRDDGICSGQPDSGNMLVEADNLLGLKALLPYYAGSVKCIYIDPPYNTGNEGWEYNDAVDAPQMRSWLGKAVGAEAEDLSRHDKWLCMMYPRLQLLKEFLTEDGALFVSIDDHELPHLRLILDEIFGSRNFVATIIWQKIYTIKNSAKHLSEMHDYVVLYARNRDRWQRNLQPRTDQTDEHYSNPDNDPEGPWISNALQSRNYYSLGQYAIRCPGGRMIDGPPSGTYWRMKESKLWDLHRKGEVWWGEDGNNAPRIKKYLRYAKNGVVPSTIWFHQESGTNSEAKTELRNIVGDQQMFTTPKPVKLIKRILQLATDKDSIILDSFAGSGTTGHAVLDLNQQDGGTRRFVLVEMDPSISRNVAAVRLQRVISGYNYETRSGNRSKRVQVPPLGGGFSYYSLGEPLFSASGDIRPGVHYWDLASHIYFTETHSPLAVNQTADGPLIGVDRGTAYYLLYKEADDCLWSGAGTLTAELLENLPPHEGPKVIYGDSCTLSSTFMMDRGISFRQIPYHVEVI